jgi:hypothetical protein
MARSIQVLLSEELMCGSVNPPLVKAESDEKKVM